MNKFNYIIEEEYENEKIVVNVCEYWSNYTIERADVSCPKYSVLSRTLGVKDGAGRFTVSDVHNAIMKEVMIAQESISFRNHASYDGLNRCKFKVIVNYCDEEIVVNVDLDANSDTALIYCKYSDCFKTASLKNNSFRYAIIREVENAKVNIDNGNVLPSTIFSKVKKKLSIR